MNIASSVARGNRDENIEVFPISLTVFLGTSKDRKE